MGGGGWRGGGSGREERKVKERAGRAGHRWEGLCRVGPASGRAGLGRAGILFRPIPNKAWGV